MGILGGIITAPFKIAGGVLEGASEAVNTLTHAYDRDEGEVCKALFSLGTLNMLEGGLKGAKQAMDDITEDKEEAKGE